MKSFGTEIEVKKKCRIFVENEIIFIMIRTVIIPDKNVLSFNIPDKYIGKKMEVIAFAVDEPSEDIIYSSKSSKSFAATKINTKGYKFNREQANER